MGRVVDVGPPRRSDSPGADGSASSPVTDEVRTGRRHGRARRVRHRPNLQLITAGVLLTVLAAMAAVPGRLHRRRPAGVHPLPLAGPAELGEPVRLRHLRLRLRRADHLRHPRLAAAGGRRGRRRRARGAGPGHAGRLRGRMARRRHLPDHRRVVGHPAHPRRHRAAQRHRRARPAPGHRRPRRVQLAADGPRHAGQHPAGQGAGLRHRRPGPRRRAAPAAAPAHRAQRGAAARRLRQRLRRACSSPPRRS